MHIRKLFSVSLFAWSFMFTNKFPLQINSVSLNSVADFQIVLKDLSIVLWSVIQRNYRRCSLKSGGPVKTKPSQPNLTFISTWCFSHWHSLCIGCSSLKESWQGTLARFFFFFNVEPEDILLIKTHRSNMLLNNL